MKITFLGTGSSTGIPILGCHCSVCRSKKSRNKRFRPSLLLSYAGRNVLIDTPPELRLALIKNKIDDIDAVLFTHCHADHVYGLDDVRVFCRNKRIPVYGAERTLKEIKSIFPYVFKRTQKGGGKPKLRLRAINKTFRIFGKKFTPLPVYHGNKMASGFRMDDVAYIPDYSGIPKGTWRLLEDLNILILDALRDTPHTTHVSLSESIEVAKRIGARKTLFTHISHKLDHFKTGKKLPPVMALAFDGLTLPIDF
jgi:phosphoribosyl 1,2-cyclic phosphate phosphodiesterase